MNGRPFVAGNWMVDNTAAGAGVRDLYDGGVTGKNAAESFAQPDTDGALVDGKGLEPEFMRAAHSRSA